jgi:hypothetical protein
LTLLWYALLFAVAAVACERYLARRHPGLSSMARWAALLLFLFLGLAAVFTWASQRVLGRS